MKRSVKIVFIIIITSVFTLFTSCDVYDSAGDCSVHYKLPITFTQNIQGTDGFPAQVRKVTLYVYDRDGNPVLCRTEDVEDQATTGYMMALDVPPGRYSVLAWCEGEPTDTPATAFVTGDDYSDIRALSATLPLETDEDGTRYCDRDIVPLFHGYKADIEFPDTYGTVILPALDLMKDTNILNVSVENIDGTEISPEALSIYIETDNSEMNWDNSLAGSTPFRHYPWSVTTFSSDRGNEEAVHAEAGGDYAHVTGLLAELTMGRIMTARKPVLVIHRESDNHDVRFDLVQLLCMVRGHYKGHLTDQQYLDRMDFHELTFFVDAGLNWYTAAGITINGWKVVAPASVDI